MDKALEYLYSLEMFGIKLGLQNMSQATGDLNNPHHHLQFIHVAGTNGKGSVCMILASILEKAGYKVGLYTSPHIKRFRERIQINGTQIATSAIIHLTKKIRDQTNVQLTFFEFTTLLALLYFQEKKVDLVVWETGLGGRLDATNIVIPLVSVITTISLEHQAYLGDTLEKIGLEKAGIIKQGVPVITGVSGPAFRVIEKKAREQNSPLTVASPMTDSKVSAHQRLNRGIVMEVIRQLQKKGFPLSNHTLTHGLNCPLPARMEKRGNIIFDVAHNPEAIAALVTQLKGKVITILGVMKDKDYKAIIKLLEPKTKRFIFTRPNTERAADPYELQKCTSLPSMVIPFVKKALDHAKAIASPTDTILVTGSFYTVGEVYDR